MSPDYRGLRNLECSPVLVEPFLNLLNKEQIDTGSRF
jgi:hypothetical protein